MRLLHLASNRIDVDWEPGDEFLYPYEVMVVLDAPAPHVWVAEGVTHGAAAARLTPHEALAPRWHDHVVKAGGLWLGPYLRRLTDGEAVSEAELVDAFTAIHGRAPRIQVVPDRT